MARKKKEKIQQTSIITPLIEVASTTLKTVAPFVTPPPVTNVINAVTTAAQTAVSLNKNKIKKIVSDIAIGAETPQKGVSAMDKRSPIASVSSVLTQKKKKMNRCF